MGDALPSIVFITGMHRSGTSFLSRALNLCGLDLPEPDTKGNKANEKGRWENRRLSNAGRKLFGPVDRWYHPVIIDDTTEVLQEMKDAMAFFNGQCTGRWGWKDPRILITFEYWNRVMDGRPFDLVVSIRNPLEVAESLRKRNGFDVPRSLRLWEYHYGFALDYMRKGYPIHLFNFNEPDRKREIERLCHRLNLNPNPAVWNDWFEGNLVHHQISQGPDLRAYQAMLKSWEKQRHETTPGKYKHSGVSTWIRAITGKLKRSATISAAEKSAAEQPVAMIKPTLTMAILIVNGTDNYKDSLWAKLCIDQILKNTSPYHDFKIFLWNHDVENTKLREYLESVSPFVEVLTADDVNWKAYPGPVYDVPETSPLYFRGFHVHRTPLQLLYEHAARYYELDTVFTFDTDSWPVRGNWDVPIMAALNGEVKLVGVWRDELQPTVPPFVHASGLGVKQATIRELGLRFDYQPQGPEEDTLYNFTVQVRDKYGMDAIFPLKRSNAKNYHPVFGGVYHGLIYHHHLGSRYQEGKNLKLKTKGWEDRGENLEMNKMILDAMTEMVFTDPDALVVDLVYGNRAFDFKLFQSYLQNETSQDHFQRLRQRMLDVMNSHPVDAFFLSGLITRHFAFDTETLAVFQKIGTATNNSIEANGYTSILNRFDQLDIRKNPT